MKSGVGGGTGRRPRVATAAALLALTAFITPAAGQEPPTEELEEARQAYDEAVAEEAGVLADFEAASARLASLDAQAAELDADIAAAEAGLVDTAARLTDARAEVATARGRATETQRALEAAHERLEAQAVAAYVGRVDPLVVFGEILATEEPARVEATLTYAGAVLDDQQAAIDEHRRAREAAEAQTDALDAAVADATAIREELAGHRDALESARADLEAVRVTAAAETAHQQGLMVAAAAHREAYERRVAELQAESDRVAELLRQRQLAEEAVAARDDAPAPRADNGGGGSSTTTTTTTRPPSAARLANPLDRMVIVSRFGYRIHPIYETMRLHTGIDLDGDTGDRVMAAASGSVVEAGARGNYGNTVIIDHGRGLATLYAHLDSIAVSRGDAVDQSERVGALGSTGASTGPHLHFEVRLNGVPVDPEPYLP